MFWNGFQCIHLLWVYSEPQMVKDFFFFHSLEACRYLPHSISVLLYVEKCIFVPCLTFSVFRAVYYASVTPRV